MSRISIVRALEAAYRSAPAVPTIYEDGADPSVDTGPTATYQKTWTIWAEPITDEISKAQTERGVYQMTLMTPAGEGIGPALARAEELKPYLGRGETPTADGIVVVIESMKVGVKRPNGDHDATPIEVRFWANCPAT